LLLKKVYRFGLVLLILLICKSVKADDAVSEVFGLVIDKTSNEIVSSASVILESKTNNFITESDFFGNYEIKNITEGNYHLNVKRLGYQIYSGNIYIQKGSRLKINIYLVPIQMEIEKINVTATKSELTLQRTPSSLNIISSEDINSRNIMTFDQVLENVQGVTINRTSPINVSSLSIRGSSDVAGGGIGNRVLLLLDGRPSLTGDSKGALWSLIPVSIIEKTEVVKGAFSSLYGSSAIGGVINVISKKPTYKSFTAINLNYGFYEKLSEAQKFSDKLQSFSGLDLLHSNTLNKFGYLFNFNFRQNNGYAQQTDFKFYSGIAKLTYDLFSNRDLEFTFQYTNSQSAYPHYWRKDAGKYDEPYKVAPYLLNDRINKESQSFDLFYRAIPNSKSKYTSRFYYFGLKSESQYNPNNPVSHQFGIPGEVFKTFINSYNFGNISQVDLNLSKNNYFISGIDLQWNIVRSSPESIVYGNQQQYNLALFAQDQMNLSTDKYGNTIFSSTLASRIDYSKFIGGVQTFQLSPKLSFIYSPPTNSKIFENSSFRILFGRAFRNPSIAEQFFKKELFGGFDFVYNPNLKSEEMLSAEIGFRKQYDNRFILDLSFYFNKYDNLIQYVNIGSSIYGPFQVQNIAKSQIRGFEFLLNYSSKFRIVKEYFHYKFEFSYSLNDARDLSDKRPDDFLPYKPKHLLNLNVDLNYFGFEVNTNGRFVSKVDEVLFFRNEEPKSYFLLDMKLSKKINNTFSIFIAVNNLTDIFYQELERIAAPNRNYTTGINIKF
jgi:outer membrane receptor protein involved in Fe transport